MTYLLVTLNSSQLLSLPSAGTTPLPLFLLASISSHPRALVMTKQKAFGAQILTSQQEVDRGRVEDGTFIVN